MADGGFEVYRQYVALKSHFNTDSYDYFKYKEKSRATHKSYMNRNDKSFFEKLGRFEMGYVVSYLVANFVSNENLWIGDVALNQESDEVYFAWKRKLSRLYTGAIEDVANMKTFMEKRNLTVDDLFKIDPKSQTQPIIFRLMIQRYISMETYLILDDAIGFSKVFDRKFDGDYVYEKWSLKARKYKPFLVLDKKRCENVAKNLVFGG